MIAGQILLNLILISVLAAARSGEIVDVEIAQVQVPNARAASLPRCVDGKDEVAHIRDGMNSKPLNYNPYREAFRKESDAELLARLAYAETKGSNCPNLEKQVAKAIVSSISNRARIRSGNVKSVVYEPMQFNSSMAIYSESKYQDFLCPKDSELWAAVLADSHSALEGKPPVALNPKAVNYFLYQHSPRWKKEPWVLPEDTAQTTPELQKCVRFFINSSWK